MSITGTFNAQPPQYLLTSGSGFTATQAIQFSLTGDGVSSSFVVDLSNLNPASLGLGTPSSPVISVVSQQVAGSPRLWQPITSYSLNTVVLAPNGTLQKATTPGISFGVPWQAGTSYTAGNTIVDPVGNYQKCIAAGTSGTVSVFRIGQIVGSTTQDGGVSWLCVSPTPTTFSAVNGALTSDGTVVWTCQGPNNVIPVLDSPTGNGAFVGTVLTITFSEALKAPGPVTDTYGNVFNIQPWTANVSVTFSAVSTTQPASSVSISNFPPSQTVAGTISVSNLPASQPVSGTVAVSNFPASQAVTGTFFQGTQPVSGTVTANAGTGTFVTSDSNAQAQGSATSGQKGFLELGAVTTANPAYSTTQTSPLSLTTVGALRTDKTSVAGTVTVTAAAGVQRVGIAGSANATLDTTVGSGGAPTNALYTVASPTSVAAGAYSPQFINGTGAATVIKASAGNLYGLSLTNGTASPAFIEFFNGTTAPTLGTSTVVFCIPLPASANVTLSPGTIALMQFGTGIGFACTTTENGTSTAAVTGMIFFK